MPKKVTANGKTFTFDDNTTEEEIGVAIDDFFANEVKPVDEVLDVQETTIQEPKKKESASIPFVTGSPLLIQSTQTVQGNGLSQPQKSSFWKEAYNIAQENKNKVKSQPIEEKKKVIKEIATSQLGFTPTDEQIDKELTKNPSKFDANIAGYSAKKYRDEKVANASVDELLADRENKYQELKDSKDLLAGYQQSREGKISELVNDVKEGNRISESDFNYLKQNAPKAVKDLFAGVENFNDDYPIENINTVADINRENRLQQNRVDNHAQIQNTITQLGRFVDVNKLGTGEVATDLDKIREQMNAETIAVQKKYPTETYGNPKLSSFGKTIPNATKQAEVKAIEDRYNSLIQAVANADSYEFAIKNKDNANPLNVGLHWMQIKDPTRYQNYVNGGSKNKTVEADASKIGIQLLQSTGDADLIDKGIKAEKVFDIEYPQDINDETRRRLAIEKIKQQGGTNNVVNKPYLSLAEGDEYANQLPQKYKDNYYNNIRPNAIKVAREDGSSLNIFNALVGDDVQITVPSSGGIVDEFIGGFLQPIVGTVKTISGAFESKEEKANRALGKTPIYEQKLIDRDIIQNQLKELNDKPKLTIEEINKRNDLEEQLTYKTKSQSVVDGMANLTGQVLAQAGMTYAGAPLVSTGLKGVGLGVKGLGYVNRAEQVATFAGEIKNTMNIAGSTSAYLSSYDDARLEAERLMPTASNLAKLSYASGVASLNALSERIFKDEKIFDAFKKEVSPEIAVLVKNLSSGKITEEAFKTSLDKTVKKIATKYAPAIVVENQKEAFEEVVTQAGTTILKGIGVETGAIAERDFNMDSELDALKQVYIETTISGLPTGVLAGVGDTRRNNISQQAVYDFSINPEKIQEFNDVINYQQAQGQMSEGEAISKIKSANTLQEIGSKVIPNIETKKPLNNREKVALTNLFFAKRKLTHDIENDPDTKSLSENQLAIVDKKINDILLGKVVVDENFDVYTEQEYNQKLEAEKSQVIGVVETKNQQGEKVFTVNNPDGTREIFNTQEEADARVVELGNPKNTTQNDTQDTQTTGAESTTTIGQNELPKTEIPITENVTEIEVGKPISATLEGKPITIEKTEKGYTYTTPKGRVLEVSETEYQEDIANNQLIIEKQKAVVSGTDAIEELTTTDTPTAETATNDNVFTRDDMKSVSDGTGLSKKGTEVMTTDKVESNLRVGDKITFFAEKERSGVWDGKAIKDESGNPWGVMGILADTNGWIRNDTKIAEAAPNDVSVPIEEDANLTDSFLNEASDETNPFHELAKALKGKLGGVVTKIVNGVKDIFGNKQSGNYANNQIQLDGKNKKQLQTFFHEAMHHFTVDKLLQFERGDLSKLTDTEIDGIENLKRIFEESKTKLEAKGIKVSGKNGHYGFTDIHEFISEAFANPEFQRLLKELPSEGKSPTMFKAFLDAVAKLIGLKDATILDDIFHHTEKLINSKKETAESSTPTPTTVPIDAAPTNDALKDVEVATNSEVVDDNVESTSKNIFKESKESISEKIKSVQSKVSEAIKKGISKWGSKKGYYGEEYGDQNEKEIDIPNYTFSDKRNVEGSEYKKDFDNYRKLTTEAQKLHELLDTVNPKLESESSKDLKKRLGSIAFNFHSNSETDKVLLAKEVDNILNELESRDEKIDGEKLLSDYYNADADESQIQQMKNNSAEITELIKSNTATSLATNTPTEKPKADALKDVEGATKKLFHSSVDGIENIREGALISELGIHFGTKETAETLNGAKGGTVKEYDVDIKNPIEVPDFARWEAFVVSRKLLQMGILTEAEHKKINKQTGNDKERELLKVLKSKGYDGFVYDNAYEGGGKSYVAFDKSQVKPTTALATNTVEQTTKNNNDAIQEQTANESVLRTEQPEMGLQEVGEGNTKSESVTEQVKTTAKEETVTPIQRITGNKDAITLSGLTEVERQKQIIERDNSLKLSKAKEDESKLSEQVRRFNEMRRNDAKRPRLLNDIKKQALEQGFEVKYNGVSVEVFKKNKSGKPTKINFYLSDIGRRSVTDEKALHERSEAVQELYVKLMDLDIDLDARNSDDNSRFSESQIQSAITDIENGIPSRQANEILNKVEKLAETGKLEVGDKVSGYKSIPIDELITEAEAVRDEQLFKDLTNDEVFELYANDILASNENDNIINQEYERINNEGAVSNTPQKIATNSGGTNEKTPNEEGTNKATSNKTQESGIVPDKIVPETSIVETGKKIADAIRKLKSDKDSLQTDLTLGLKNLALEEIAQLIEDGAVVIDAITKVLSDAKYNSIDKDEIKKIALSPIVLGSGKKVSYFHSNTTGIYGKLRLRNKSGFFGIYFSPSKQYSKKFGDFTYKTDLYPQNTLTIKDKSEFKKYGNIFNISKDSYDSLIKEGYDSIAWYRDGKLMEFIVLDTDIIGDMDLHFLNHPTKTSKSEKNLSLADKIRALKSPKGSLQTDLTLGLKNLALEEIAQLVEDGAQVIDAIAQVLKNAKYNSLNPDDLNKEIVRKLAPISEQNKAFLDNVIKDIESGKTTLEEAVKELNDDLPKRFAEKYIKYLNDNYTPKQEIKNEKTEEAKTKTEVLSEKTSNGNTRDENDFIHEILSKEINETEYPLIAQDVNGSAKQETAKTQGEVQDRSVDGNYVKVTIENLKEIALETSKKLEDKFGDKWVEKTLNFLESRSVSNAQMIGVLNAMSTKVMDDMKATDLSEGKYNSLRAIQKRIDNATNKISRIASIALNMRKVLRKFAEGGNINEVLAQVVLTNEVRAEMKAIDESIKRIKTDEEINNATTPTNPKGTQKTSTQSSKSQTSKEELLSNVTSKADEYRQKTGRTQKNLRSTMKDIAERIKKNCK